MSRVLPFLLLALCVEGTFAEVGEATTSRVIALQPQINQEDGFGEIERELDVVFLQLPGGLDEPARRLARAHSGKLGAILEDKLGPGARTAVGAWRPLFRAMADARDSGDSAFPAAAVALLEVSSSKSFQAEATDAMFLGATSVIAVTVATYCSFQLFYHAAFFKKVGMGNGLRGLEGILESQSSEVILKPSGFTQVEKIRYQDYLQGHTEGLAPNMIRKFELRKIEEEEVYIQTLLNKMYVATFSGKKFAISVVVPTLLYFLLQVVAYVSAYELGRHVS